MLQLDAAGLRHHHHRGDADDSRGDEIPRRRQRIAGHANEPSHHELGGPAENGDGERIGDVMTGVPSRCGATSALG